MSTWLTLWTLIGSALKSRSSKISSHCGNIPNNTRRFFLSRGRRQAAFSSISYARYLLRTVRHHFHISDDTCCETPSIPIILGFVLLFPISDVALVFCFQPRRTEIDVRVVKIF